MISENSQEKVQHIFKVCSTAVRISMACMIVFFVQQKCGDEECGRFHMIHHGRMYVVVLNFLSFFNFVILYISETYRQFFLINNFDVVKSIPDDNLKNALVILPKLKNKLLKINKIHLYIVFINSFVYIINVICSSIVILKNYYGGLKTLTGIVTSILLVSSKLGEDLYVMYMCITTDMIGLSTSIMEPISYNVVERSQIICV
jgi:hypothetical protein